MKLDTNKLAYPGLFAPIGESDWINIDRPGSDAKTFTLRVDGVLNGEYFENIQEWPVKETPDLKQFLFEHYPVLRECDDSGSFIAAGDFGHGDQRWTKQIGDIIAELKKLRVGVIVDFNRKDKISSVILRFAKKVWADLGNKEGELLPVCCGNISTIRDAFIDAQRENGEMRAEQLSLIVECAESSHPELFDDPKHPVAIVKAIWDKIQPVAKVYMGARKLNSDNVDDAIHLLSGFCNSYTWESIQAGFPRYEDRICTINSLYTVLPALKTLSHKIRELDLGPITGFAICPRHGENDMMESHRGLAVWQTYEEAERVCKRWIETDQVKAGEVVIRPVKLSIDKGVEFLEAIELPWVDIEKLEPEVTHEEYSEAEKVLRDLEKKLASERAKMQVRLAMANLREMTEQFNPKYLRNIAS